MITITIRPEGGDKEKHRFDTSQEAFRFMLRYTSRDEKRQEWEAAQATIGVQESQSNPPDPTPPVLGFASTTDEIEEARAKAELMCPRCGCNVFEESVLAPLMLV